MFFQSWNDFIHMGGYGFYVWLSYGISLLALVLLTINSYQSKKVILRDVQQEQAREARLKLAKFNQTN